MPQAIKSRSSCFEIIKLDKFISIACKKWAFLRCPTSLRLPVRKNGLMCKQEEKVQGYVGLDTRRRARNSSTIASGFGGHR